MGANRMMIHAEPVPINWNSRLPVFASGPFLASAGDEYGWLGGFDEAGTLRCVLPYTVVSKVMLRMVRFRVETIPWGGNISVMEEKVFLNSAMKYFRLCGADLVIPATTNTIFRTYPDGATAAPYGTFIVDLRQPEDSLWGSMSSSHRRQVRLAQQQGVTIREAGDHAETAYGIIHATFAKSGLPFMNIKAFRRYLKGCGDNVKILVAEKAGGVQSCIVVPFSSSCAYYVYGGSVPGATGGAMHLLHWEAMRLFRSLNVALYDFVGVRINPEKGSKQDGLFSFKERFGGNLVEGYIWKFPLNRMKSCLYDIAARFRSGGDIVDREHHKLQNG